MKKDIAITKINPLCLGPIAHRGYHNSECTENGMKAFKRAIENNLPIELDVHISKDMELIVCHDSQLSRTTSKEGIIENLTAKEIRDNYQLLDGGVVPTLKEVLELVNEQVPLVIELKVYEKNYKPLAKRVKQELSNIKDKKNYMLISFDPRALFPFKNFGIVRSLLLCKSHYKVFFFRRFFESIDIEHVMLKEEKYQKYCKKHLSNVWTITSSEVLDEVLPYVDMVTFQEMDCNTIKDKFSK